MNDGRVNGITNGRSNVGYRRNGITNGFVNGSGAVNGFRLSYQQRRFSSKPANLKKRIAIIAVIVLLVIVVPYALVYSFPEDKVTIDGNFLDWTKSQMYHDVPDSDNPDIAISAYAVKHDANGSYFYIETEGQLFTGRSAGADGFYIFVDRDNNPMSGYFIRGIGADIVTDIIGWNGTIEHQETLVFNSTAARNDFAGFESAYSPVTAFKGGKLETSNPVIMNDRSKVLILSRSTNFKSDMSDVNFRTSGPSLAVLEDHDASDVIIGTGDRHVLSLQFTAKGLKATVESLTFDFLGNCTPVQIKAVNGEILGLSSNNTIDMIQPLEIANGETLDIDILAEFAFDTSYGSFGLRLNPGRGVGAPNNVTWMVDTIQTGAFVSYLSSVPTNISIDGAFADWSSRVPITDALGDAYSERTADFKSGDVDMRTVKIASTTDVASFYMSVNGTMLGGTSVPSALVRFVTPGPPAENITPALPAYGADFAFVFIDTDQNQSTGYEVGGAEAAIAVIGKDNSIITSKVFIYDSSGWIEIGTAQAALDMYQLEASVNYTAIGLMPGETYTVTFMTQDWSGRKDEVALALPARISAGTRSFGTIMINEIYAQSKKPHDWVELYNTGTTPVDISGWQIFVDGVPVYTIPAGTVMQPGSLYVTSDFNFGIPASTFQIIDGGVVVDTMTIPSWDNSNSWGRTGAPPYGLVVKMTPSPGKINKGQVAIPEFGDLLLPITIMPTMLFAIRRVRRSRESRKQEAVH
jgi:archaellum component FlaF (FlaF/FlaG flagellin family)